MGEELPRDWLPPDPEMADVDRLMPTAEELAWRLSERLVEEYKDYLEWALADRDVRLGPVTHVFLCASIQRAFASDPWLQEIGRDKLTDEQTVHLAQSAKVALRFAVWEVLKKEGRL